MKKKYILGGLAVAALGLFAVMNLKQSFTPYVSFADARRANSTVQINGKLVKDTTRYDFDTGVLRFRVKSEKGDMMPVEYHKPKPANFDQSTGIVLVGEYKNGVFQASDLLVKCPSKYERKAEQ